MPGPTLASRPGLVWPLACVADNADEVRRVTVDIPSGSSHLSRVSRYEQQEEGVQAPQPEGYVGDHVQDSRGQ